MNTSKPALTAIQQGTVERARQFHAHTTGRGRSGHPAQADAYKLGVALAHIQLLLDIIDDLTGGET